MILFVKLNDGTLINVSNIESIKTEYMKGIKIKMVSGEVYSIKEYESATSFINSLYDKSDKEIDWCYL